MMRSLYEAFERSASQRPDAIALIHRSRRDTYGELRDAVHTLAARLRDLGVRRGDRVVLCAGNRRETVAGFWAVQAIGGVAVVISPEQDASAIDYVVGDSEAACLLTTSSLFDRLGTSRTRHPHLLGAILVDTAPALAAPMGDQVASIAYPERAAGVDLPPAGTISEDLAALMYTSGSTGRPKGVMLSHANMLCALDSLNTYLGNRPEDVFLDVLPLAFDYGLYQMLMAFSVGATLVLERDMQLPLQILKDIERHRCTNLPGVPIMFELLDRAASMSHFDLSHVRYVTNTGAALLPKHIETIRRLFPTAEIFSMYGLTECKRCTYLPPRLIDTKAASVGIAIPNTEIVVVDDEDRLCAPNVIGQLVVRGGTVMQGYWRCPDATAERIRSHPVTGGRCLYTGDYGYLDEDGLFYFKGRMDEVVKVRGRKLIPREVEDVLRRIPGVREAAVTCAPRDDGDHEISAFVELEDHAEIDEASLRGACRASLERFQVPTRYHILDRLPRNENGKIDKPALAQRFPEVEVAGVVPAAAV
jgi:amino acid adenylation domain-containing protein